MRIELRGIIEFYDNGHSHLDVVVKVEENKPFDRHNVGLDIKPNRGRIQTFLASMYGVRPGEIVWPEHIRVENG